MRGRGGAVLALVEEEPGLLPAGDVHQELRPADGDLDRSRRRLAAPDAAAGRNAFLLRRLVVAPIVDSLRRGDLHQQVEQFLLMRGHAGRQELHDEEIRISVHDQAGQPVRFGEDEPVRIGDFRQPEHVAPEPERRFEPAAPEGVVHRLVRVPREEPDEDLRVGVVDSAPDELPVGVGDGDDGAFFRRAFDARGGAGEDPRMPQKKRLRAARVQVHDRTG